MTETDTPRLLEAARRAEAVARTAESHAEHLRGKSRDAVTDLLQSIRGGGTTGDVWLDYVILISREVNEDLAQRLRDIAAQVLVHPGELVLVIHRDEQLLNCTGFGADAKYGRDEKWYLGLLDQEPEMIIDLAHHVVMLPTKCYVSFSRSQMLTAVNGEMTPSWSFNWGLLLTQPIKPLRYDEEMLPAITRETLMELEIIVGNQAINDRISDLDTMGLRLDHPDRTLANMMKALDYDAERLIN